MEKVSMTEMSFKELKKTWGGERTIEYVMVYEPEKICAFRSTVKTTGGKEKVVEGLAKLENIVNVKDDAEIENFAKNIHKNKEALEEYLLLCKKEIRDLFRKELYGAFDFHDKLEKMEVTKPYSYFADGGNADDVELVFASGWDNSLRDINGNELPQATYFDYMMPGPANDNYDLEECLEILKQRNDIKWLNEHLFEDEPKIQSIPWYNSSSEKRSCLYFVWIPGEDDWDKYQTQLRNKRYSSLDEKEVILKDIFGLKKKDERN